jgi:hypothetical protein
MKQTSLQGILAAKKLKAQIPGSADELCRLGNIAAGVLHAHDMGTLWYWGYISTELFEPIRKKQTIDLPV